MVAIAVFALSLASLAHAQSAGLRKYELASGARLIVNDFGSFALIPKGKTCGKNSDCPRQGLAFRISDPKGKERYIFNALTVSSDADGNQKPDLEAVGFEGPKPGSLLDESKSPRLAFAFRSADGQVSFQVVLEIAKGAVQPLVQASATPNTKIAAQVLLYPAGYDDVGPVPVLPGCKPDICPPECLDRGCLIKKSVALKPLRELPPLDQARAAIGREARIPL